MIPHDPLLAIDSGSGRRDLRHNVAAMPPAARLTDMHMCPMVTPGVPPIPHVGGPITGPGQPNVLIGGLPAARIGDMAVCVGPPATIVTGAFTVLIGNKPAARMGDMTAHGGSITIGLPTVLIGMSAQATALETSARNGTPFCLKCELKRLARAAAQALG